MFKKKEQKIPEPCDHGGLYYADNLKLRLSETTPEIMLLTAEGMCPHCNHQVRVSEYASDLMGLYLKKVRKKSE